MELLLEEAPEEFVGSGEVLELKEGAGAVILPAAWLEHTQRQDKVSNPHSEHAHDVIVIRRPQ